MKRLFPFLAILLLCSCTQQEQKKNSVARVYDSYLYADDLSALLPDNMSKSDSVLLVKNFINDWAKQRLLIKKAEINMGDSLAEIDELVNQYRRDLLVSKYKEAVIEQYLDTLATSEDVTLFYEENKEIFRLNKVTDVNHTS